MFLRHLLPSVADVETRVGWVYLAGHQRTLDLRQIFFSIWDKYFFSIWDKYILNFTSNNYVAANLMHCATNKQFLLMLTVVAVMTMMPIVIVTCLDRLPRNFNFRSIWTFSECELVFTFLGHWPPSQVLKLSLIIMGRSTSRLEIYHWTWLIVD